MKKIILFILLFYCFNRIYSQIEPIAFATVGASGIVTDNNKFNTWTQSEFNKKVGSFPIGINLEIGFSKNKYRFGVDYMRGFPTQIYSLDIGRVIINKNNFTLTFNFDLGVGNSIYSNMKPPDYVPTPDEIGKTMKLIYNPWYLGISSKNFFLTQNKNDKRHIESLLYLFDVKVGYLPNATWEYGYQEGGRFFSPHYNSRKISGIPHLSNFCFSLNLSIGIYE